MNQQQEFKWDAGTVAVVIVIGVIVLWLGAAFISPTGDIRDVFSSGSGGGRYMDEGERELRRLEADFDDRGGSPY